MFHVNGDLHYKAVKVAYLHVPVKGDGEGM